MVSNCGTTKILQAIVHDRCPSIADVFDAMALAHMTKSFGASAFDEMALKYYQLIIVPLALNGCHRVDVVFDQ